MNNKFLTVVISGVLLLVLLVSSVSAATDNSTIDTTTNSTTTSTGQSTTINYGHVFLRPLNQVNHPGLLNPYKPPKEGPNHMGISDYSSKYSGISELCEQDTQIRPMNQGLNIVKFFVCSIIDA